ncbi:MAG: DNA cytosine methyltransferase [Terriglobales bacterium]|jgi:DNA (cytosine-5)-methyltransferase 1
MISTLDLFCGAGGLSLGFAAAGFKTIAAVEIDQASVETFALHTPNTQVFNIDICDVPLRDFKGKVDLVIGGPPCQPFSSGGLRASESDHRDMVPEFVRAIEEVKPYAFLMENVPGLTVSDRRIYLNRIVAEFTSQGYRVVWKVLSAEDFGVPQRRRRLFIVGIRDRTFSFPAPTHGPGLKAFAKVADVITKEPRGIPNTSKVFYAKNVDLRPSPYHGLLFNGGGRALDFTQPSPTIISAAGGNRTHFVDTLSIVPEYHAYLMNGGTPRTGPVEGCRRITAVESALLQSFPESVRFVGRMSAQYRQVGNAVPPKLAEAIARSLYEQVTAAESLDDLESLATQADLFDVEVWSSTVSKPKLTRNLSVEKAVTAALNRIDDLLAGAKLELPSANYRRAIDDMMSGQSPSVRTAFLFLVFYWLADRNWNQRGVPVGTRGVYGDKKLCDQLTIRGITLHGAITAFGENLGWKGNVRRFDLSQDARFHVIKEFKGIASEELRRVADYIASRFAESRVLARPLPAVGDEVLTFAKAKLLLHKLIATPSEGHIQQFLIAALLWVHRQRYGFEIETHHPHASDTFDGTAGDIEEKSKGILVRAYEVTVRDDWMNRISDFRGKMDTYGLQKYVIIASNINANPEWSEPAKLLTNLEPYGRDIAVVDILDVLNVFAAELSATELRTAVNRAFEYISNRKLCGRADVRDAFHAVVSDWLDKVQP